MPFFQDETTPTFYVLVYRKDLARGASNKLHAYLENIKNVGLLTELDDSSISPDIQFLKIHIPDKTILKFSTLLDLDLEYQTLAYRPKVDPPPALFSNILTRPNEEDPIYARAPESVSGQIPTTIVSTERIMLVHHMLWRIRFGESRDQYGLRKLLRDNVLIDALPLHDGDFKWTETGPLNDRQLLARYWGCAAAWYKVQPLNLIEKYYGTEYGLYFAWLGFYIKMLIPAAIVSAIIVALGLLTMRTPLNILTEDVCYSKMLMCPRCHYKRCRPEFLKESCYNAYMAYLFDNPMTILFAVFMAIWSTVFMECFQRTEAVLQLQWNLSRLEDNGVMRPEFVQKANRWKYSPVTGMTVPRMSKKQMCCRYTLTIVSVLLLFVIIVTTTLLVMIYRVSVTLILNETVDEGFFSDNKDLVASVTGSILTAICIAIFQIILEKLTTILTNLENHRTSYAHTNAYIYKRYALAFVNNYTAVFYIAFFKGRFYTFPGDIKLWTRLGGLGSDTCNFTGCIADLAILLFTIMIVNCLKSNLCHLRSTKNCFLKKYMAGIDEPELKDFESDFLLPPVDHSFIMGKYLAMVIQYGFVIFFVVCFPLAPLFALLNNLLELRIDAWRLTKRYRRPVPSRVVGLGAWFAILQAVTYIGVVVNALVIAFTSNFMAFESYKVVSPIFKLYGFINITISEYAVDDFEIIPSEAKPDSIIVKAANSCFYRGQRNPPHHPQQYQHTNDYWKSTAIKFAMVIFFEHALMMLKGLLAYAIPDVPFKVREQVNSQRKTEKKDRNKALMEEYLSSIGDTKLEPLNI